MSHSPAMENVLAIGIDPHREKHEVVGIKFPERIVLEKEYTNEPSGHRALLRTARTVAAEHDLTLVFGLECSGSYGYSLGRYLAAQGCRVKEVNPRMTSRQRVFYGQDKTNHIDALAAAAIVLRAYERLPDVKAIQEATEATRDLSRYREELVKQQTVVMNQLHNRLAYQYPAYKTFFNEVNGVTALRFWMAYPTQAHLQDVTLGELTAVLAEASNTRIGEEKARLILEQVDSSQSAEAPLLLDVQGDIIRNLAERLLQLKRSIEAIEARLEETVAATGQQLTSFKGLGTVLAGVFIGETLDTTQFDNDKDKFAKYNGSAPVTKGTGNQSHEVENQWCNRRLKGALSQLALNARLYQPLSQAYYQRCLDRGLPPGEARKRLMRRLSDIIFAMMRDRTAYDPEVHHQKQRKHKEKGKRVAPAAGGG